MTFEVMGRSSKKTKLLQRKFTLGFGRDEFKNDVLLDIFSSQIILICGKRGTGKSYGLGVFAEEFDNLPDDIKNDYSVIYIDPMGIFWTMNFPNEKIEEQKLLVEWNLTAKKVNAAFYVTEGQYNDMISKKEMSFVKPISFLPAEVSASDWCSTFDFDENKPQGIAITRAVKKLRANGGDNYTIGDIINAIKGDPNNAQTTVDSLENRFLAATDWGIFSNKGFSFMDLIRPGKISIVDVSAIRNTGNIWGIRSLIVSLIGNSIFKEKVKVRREKEMARILKQAHRDSYAANTWFIIDEAHNFVPTAGNVPSKEILRTLILEGRQPGISMVLATQQPGSLLPDVLSQCDIIISHHLTKKEDIDSLNNIMQSYQKKEIKSYLKEINKDNPGQAIVMDNTSENIMKITVRPRQSWHGGGSPNEDKNKGSEHEDLSFLDK